MYTVYMHKFPNGKVYVGITKNSIYKRWANGQGYRHNKRMTNAIKRYGWENVSHIIIDENLSKEEACKLEIEKIKEFDSTNEENGYNYSTGGESGSSGVKQSEETIRKRIQNTNGGVNPFLGKKHTEETRKKMSAACKGRKRSEEDKIKISKKLKGVKKSEETKLRMKKAQEKNRKKVICLTTGIIYDSISDAAKAIGASNSNITCACNGTYKKTHKMEFRFLEQ